MDEIDLPNMKQLLENFEFVSLYEEEPLVKFERLECKPKNLKFSIEFYGYNEEYIIH